MFNIRLTQGYGENIMKVSINWSIINSIEKNIGCLLGR